MSEYIDVKFCHHIGKLFYAIASVDGNVREEERHKLIEVLNDEWLPLKVFDTTNKASVVNTFEWLHYDNEYDAETCYKSFISYKRANETHFNDEMKSLILKTASKIASSYSSENKSELMMLAKLSIEFKK